MLSIFQEIIICQSLSSLEGNEQVPITQDVNLLLHVDFGVAATTSFSLQSIMAYTANDSQRKRIVLQLCEAMIANACKHVKPFSHFKVASDLEYPGKKSSQNLEQTGSTKSYVEVTTLAGQLVTLLKIWNGKLQKSQTTIQVPEIAWTDSKSYFEKTNCVWIDEVQETIIGLLSIPSEPIWNLLVQAAEQLKLIAVHAAIPESCIPCRSPFLIDFLSFIQLPWTPDLTGLRIAHEHPQNPSKRRSSEDFPCRIRSSQLKMRLSESEGLEPDSSIIKRKLPSSTKNRSKIIPKAGNADAWGSTFKQSIIFLRN